MKKRNNSKKDYLFLKTFVLEKKSSIMLLRM